MAAFIRKYSLTLAIVFFLVYFANVLVGKFVAGAGLGVVGEFLLLLTACVFFTIAILRAEADARQ